MIDYTIFYKEKYAPDSNWNKQNQWDIFISAYNSSERVKKVFEKVQSTKKDWLILPDYDYDTTDYPSNGSVFAPNTNDEADFIQQYFDKLNLSDLKSERLCIDITGFMRPHLMFCINYLMATGICKFDVLYSDPIQYKNKEQTKFSNERVNVVRQVKGFEGNHIPDTSNDILIIGAGYDHNLISHVATNKDKASKIQIFAFPSLQADMYQESVLRANIAAESIGINADQDLVKFFAPANDPFVTASVLQEIVNKKKLSKPITNLYLSPLATKPQALGFAIYYLMECQNEAASIIFPICDKYTRETSVGISKIWKYTVELS